MSESKAQLPSKMSQKRIILLIGFILFSIVATITTIYNHRSLYHSYNMKNPPTDSDPKPEYWSPKTGEHGMNELHYAAYCEDLEAVRHLVEQGVDVNHKDDSGWTAVTWSVDMCCTGPVGAAESIVMYLVDHGASLDYPKGYKDFYDFADDRHSEVGSNLREMLANRQFKRNDSKQE